MSRANSPSEIPGVADSSKLELNEPLTKGQRGEFTEKTRALMKRIGAIDRVVEEYDECDFVVDGCENFSLEELCAMQARARTDGVKHLAKLRMVLAQLKKFYQWDSAPGRAKEVVFVRGLIRKIERNPAWEAAGRKRAREGDDNSGGDSPPTKKSKADGDGATATDEASLVSGRETQTSGPDDQPTEKATAEASPPATRTICRGMKTQGMFARVVRKPKNKGPDSRSPSPPQPICRGTKTHGMFANVVRKPKNEGPDSPADLPSSSTSSAPHSLPAPPAEPRPFVLGYVSGSVFDADDTPRRPSRRMRPSTSWFNQAMLRD